MLNWLRSPKREPVVDFISKIECHLCDDAYEALEQIQKSIPCQVTVRKIDDDPELYEAHKYEVPVIFIDGKKSFFGKVNPMSLERALKIASRKGGS